MVGRHRRAPLIILEASGVPIGLSVVVRAEGHIYALPLDFIFPECFQAHRN